MGVLHELVNGWQPASGRNIPRAHHVAHHLISLQKKRNVYSVYSVFSASSPPALLLQHVYSKFQQTTWQDKQNHKHQNMERRLEKAIKGNLDERGCLPLASAGTERKSTDCSLTESQGPAMAVIGRAGDAPLAPLPELSRPLPGELLLSVRGCLNPQRPVLAHDCVALPPFLASKLPPDFSSGPRTTPSTTT